MKLRHLALMIILRFVITLTQCAEQEFLGQNNRSVQDILTTTNIQTKMTAMKSSNRTNDSTISNKTIQPPPKILFREFLRCRQLGSLNGLPSPSSCPYDYESDIRVCWKGTYNGTMASSMVEYDHGHNHFYDGVRYGIENCTIERFCQSNGTWATTISPDIQCKTCIGDGRPVKFNSISIMIETMSLSLSLISLTIAVLCMINVNGRHYPPPRLPKYRYIAIPPNTPLLCKCFLLFRRLHLPRNLLHMHLFVAFIFRSIVKLVFIHLILGGYTRTMIMYTQDKCGNIEVFSKSSDLFHIFGCRLLSSLFWYTDAVSQTFIFCEALFLFTALTSHLFRDRGCLPFVLWGWLSPLVWLTMWIASHIITDRFKQRSTCWLEGDNTTYFYYFFYVPYAFYLLVNFGIYIYLVRLLYSKYQSNNVQTSRTGNRHLIKSILILIPLFGLHSLLVMWVFYHKNQGHTIWYYISVTLKAVFGDLQGFFTSLIYFYFNTEIRYEVLRQVQRIILSNDTVQRSSAGETLSTRLSTFRRSISRHRHSSIQNRNERRRGNNNSFRSPSLKKPTHEICWKKCLTLICPCLIKECKIKNTHSLKQQQQSIEQNHLNESSPAVVPELVVDEDLRAISSPLVVQIRSPKDVIEGEGMTCDTFLLKNENDNEEESLTDENDVTIQQSSCYDELPSSSDTPMSMRFNIQQLNRSNSERYVVNGLLSNHLTDSKSLR